MADPAELYRRFLLELWHAEDAELDRIAAELATPDFVIHQARVDGSQSEQVTGPAAMAELVRSGRGSFTNVTVSLVVGPVVDRDLVAGRWSFAARYAGGMPGAAASVGTPVEFGGTDLFRVAGDRLAEYWVSSDGELLMAQLDVGG